VVYSLLDDLKATSRWRRFAESFGTVSHSIVEKFKKRRKPEPEEIPAERTTSGD
jgi:hypothetical protein